MTIVLIVIAVLVVLLIVYADRRLQRPDPAAQPDRERLVADRRPAEAPPRPDPQPRRDRQGLRRPRAGDPRRRHQGPQRGDRRARHAACPGRGRQPADRRPAPGLRPQRGLPGPQGEPELPRPAGGADRHRGPGRLRAAVLQRQRARLQQQAAAVPDGDLRQHAEVRAARVLRGRRGRPHRADRRVLSRAMAPATTTFARRVRCSN